MMRKKGSPQRRFPANAAEWVTYFPSIATPANIWTFQEAAFNFADGVGSKPFTNGVAPVNFRAGTDLNGRYYMNMENAAMNSGAVFTAAPTTDFDDPGTSFCWYARVRFPVAAASRVLVGKKGTTATTNGWRLGMNNTSGFIGMVYDSPGASTSTLSTTINYVDGSFHDFIGGFNRTVTNVAYVITELENINLSLGAHTTFANSTNFGLGDINAGSASSRAYLSYLAYWPNTILTGTNMTTIRTPV